MTNILYKYLTIGTEFNKEVVGVLHKLFNEYFKMSNEFVPKLTIVVASAD